MRRGLVTARGIFAMTAAALTTAGPAHALHQNGHPVGIAAWDIDGVPVERREDRLSETGPTAPLPVVQEGGPGDVPGPCRGPVR
jgi:hypothetical protein